MSNKRKNRNSKKFYCPHCQTQLWRLGSQKYSLFFEGTEEIQKHFMLSRKNTSLLVSQNPVQVDTNLWIEEFFCDTHSRMWILLKRATDDTVSIIRVADDQDWMRTTKTPDPKILNASVGEYTLKMSRSTRIKNHTVT